MNDSMITARMRFSRKKRPMIIIAAQYMPPRKGRSTSLRLKSYLIQVSLVIIWKTVRREVPM